MAYRESLLYGLEYNDKEGAAVAEEDFAELMNQVKQEEELLQFTSFTNEDALQIGLKIIEMAKNENKTVSIDICRSGQQLFHYAMPGTFVDNDEWIKRKNRVVNRFGRSSYQQGLYYRSLGTTISQKHFLSETEYAPHGGAFPLKIKNVGMVGTITVSGLPQKEDHSLVVRAIKEYLNIEIMQQ